MRTGFTALLAAGALLSAGSAAAADRLSDPLLTQLVQNIDRGFDAWKDDLERKNLDEALIKSAAGTIDVNKFLRSMADDIDTVKDKLKADYAAAPEVTALLRRASDVERRTQAQPPTSEAWKPLSVQYAQLAAAYGLGWPVDGSASGAEDGS